MNTKPQFLLSKKIALEKYDEINNLVDYVSYSSKTNPQVTKILEENTSSMFSIHSIHELKNIKDKSRIIFLAQGWDKKEIKYLMQKKINSFVIDNPQDLETLKNTLKGDEKIKLFLRLKLKENTLSTEKHFVFGFSSIFINKNIPALKKIPGINSLGLHFHRKTQNLTEWNFKKEIEDVLEEKTLENLDEIIMGGGLPSIYANTNTKVFTGIFKKIKELKDWTNSKNIKLISEPGRFICAPAIKLITHIKAIYDHTIVVDASVYNSDLDALIVPTKLKIENELEKEGLPYSIKGITPCSMDLFRYKVYLKNPKLNDKIIFLNAGAYNFTTDFCNLPKIETKIID